ncbi:hypothetical protein THAOC_15984, partial [Thalassiosira oceanica]
MWATGSLWRSAAASHSTCPEHNASTCVLAQSTTQCGNSPLCPRSPLSPRIERSLSRQFGSSSHPRRRAATSTVAHGGFLRAIYLGVCPRRQGRPTERPTDADAFSGIPKVTTGDPGDAEPARGCHIHTGRKSQGSSHTRDASSRGVAIHGTQVPGEQPYTGRKTMAASVGAATVATVAEKVPLFGNDEDADQHAMREAAVEQFVLTSQEDLASQLRESQLHQRDEPLGRRDQGGGGLQQQKLYCSDRTGPTVLLNMSDAKSHTLRLCTEEAAADVHARARGKAFQRTDAAVDAIRAALPAVGDLPDNQSVIVVSRPNISLGTA